MTVASARTLTNAISAHLSTEEHTKNVMLLISMMPQTVYSSAATACLLVPSVTIL